jgi:hypothetical protein
MRVRTDDVVWREVDGEVVILDLKTSTYLSTNKTGAHLWKLLQQDRDTDELETSLVDTYGVERSLAQSDVGAFLDMLRSKELLIG